MVRERTTFDSAFPNVARLAPALGQRRLTILLGITSHDLHKARSGDGPLSGAAAQRARDLDVVLARALQVLNESTIVDWLEGTEPTMGFARPINIFCVRGKNALLDILDRIASGGYA